MHDTNKPFYNIDKLKLHFNKLEKLNMTYSAVHGQLELGFSKQDVVDAIQSLKQSDFSKSMLPVHLDFNEWQDVYKSTYKNRDLYIKFQVNKNGEMIVSFKAR